MGGFCELPQELVEGILLRVDADTIVQSKLVCKKWYSLINDSEFAAKHLHYSTTMVSSSTISLLLSGLSRQNNHVISMLKIHEDDHHHPHPDKEFMVPEPSIMYVESHCNGIFRVILSSYRGIILWNPTTKRVKRLPAYPYPTNYNEIKIKVVGVGFGYDSKANEYKVVRIMKISLFRNEDYGYLHCIAEICRLSSGDCWIEIEMPIQVSFFTGEQLYCKGVYYWLISTGHRQEAILWFDMCDEKFGTIELPASNERKGIHEEIMKLMLWNDTVAFLAYNPRLILQHFKTDIEMWVLVDGYSWTKLETIGPIFLYKAFAFWKSDQLLIEDGSRQLASYNLRTKKLVRNVSSYDAKLEFLLNVYPYVKSLVSL